MTTLMADSKTHHHHHHHSHSSQRSRFLHRAFKSSVLIGVCVVAALAVLLVMYCGIKDNPNLGRLMMLCLPVFAVIGVIVGAFNYVMSRRAYDLDRR